MNPKNTLDIVWRMDEQGVKVESGLLLRSLVGEVSGLEMLID